MTHRFRYRALQANGTIEEGATTAESRSEVVSFLAHRRAAPLEIALIPDADTERYVLPLREQAIGLRMLATLMASGLPITKALAAFSDLASADWRRGIPAVEEAVRQGRSFAAALESSRIGLPPVTIGLIRAGESSGKLTEAISSAAELAEFRASAQAAIRSALAYPLLLCCASMLSIVLLIGVVIPRFALALAETATELPNSTKAMLALAGLARDGALPTLLVCCLGAVAWRAWIATPLGRLRWDSWMLAMPALGSVRRSSATSRLCAALGSLLEAGVPVATALSNASPAVSNAQLKKRLERARSRVLEGVPLSRSLFDNEVITLTATRLVRAGEESGALPKMLAHAARIENARVERLTKGAVRLIEPVLILFFGGVVALIAAALLQGLYSVRVS